MPTLKGVPPLPPPQFTPERIQELDAFVRDNATAKDFALFFDQLRREGTHPTVAASAAVRLLCIERGLRFDGEGEQVR